ncbi:response regulator transcription factor [Aquibacillus rhizosphaerae]|uniref:LytTR family transcriptional regulator DNA-binding domain-containing protein n=1 Tax=Aquibacillus rhizosphaerae TaxID=3051431 RepID=A0ABT7L246_9BACI|nr:response regulator transcription factor [Aquibacillus sp. LR5S19]MDL4839909.1 LytTR family transcriptional regulator DNA-binding domain-containing protein [Aquibacillus sp. LR5S19]
MTSFKLDYEIMKSEILPPFSLNLNESNITGIYSDTDMQAELIHMLYNDSDVTVCDWKDGLYDRLTVADNVAFYHKWFGCSIPLPEILVLFELHMCAKKPLRKCSHSEKRRVQYAKYFMMNTYPMVFQEPIHGVDVRTINTFINMLKRITNNKIPALILVSNMEHALLLSDVAYRLQEKGLQEIEVDNVKEEDVTTGTEPAFTPSTVNLFKIPAKIDDKVILFDPLEIDYIESQDGKAMIVINDESYALDSTLAEIENKLEAYGFYRCHRSYIVNLQKVREIITWSKNTYSLRIDNRVKSTIPLSRTKIQRIQEMFNL